jgi:hypothetical protein
MTIEQMTEEQIDKLELEHFRVREELQAQLQQCINVLQACRQERIKRAQKMQQEVAKLEGKVEQAEKDLKQNESN